MDKITAVISFTILGMSMSQDGFAQNREWAYDESIEQITEHVFRFGSDNQFGAFIVTDDGIIVIDGHYCGSETVAWLKAELEKRYDVPVKYTILSHDHASHTCGTEQFNNTSIAIGSRYIRPHLVFEQRESAIPEILFDNELDLHLGGVYLRLMYLGPTHSDNLIQIHLPDEGVLIAIDAATVENGCLQVIKGSHKLGRIDHVLTGDQAGADMERVDVALERLEHVYCEMEAGDVLFFHSNLLHRSDRNTSDHPRWSQICCYNAKSNNPYKESHHPCYTALKKVDDSMILKVGITRFDRDDDSVAWLNHEKDASASVLKPE